MTNLDTALSSAALKQEGTRNELAPPRNTTNSGDEEPKNPPKGEEPPAEREGKYYFRLHLNDT